MREGELQRFLQTKLNGSLGGYEMLIRPYRKRRGIWRLSHFSEPTDPVQAVSLYAVLARVEFLIGRLEGAGLDMQEERVRARENLSMLVELYQERGETVRKLVQQGLAMCFQWFEENIRGIEPEIDSFPFETDSEFEMFTFAWREEVLEAKAVAEKLGHGYDFESIITSFAPYDRRLRNILPYCVGKVVAMGGSIDPAEVYPGEYWWRRVAWEEFARLTSAQDP